MSWPALGTPFANSGHAGTGPLALVRVNPAAREGYEHLVRDSALPEGTVVAIFHLESDARTRSIYVMEKDAGGWRFMALDAAGRQLPLGGPSGQATDSCYRCHVDAVADSLFGIPRGTMSTH
jgi:hypothetical protein